MIGLISTMRLVTARCANRSECREGVDAGPPYGGIMDYTRVRLAAAQQMKQLGTLPHLSMWINRSTPHI